MRESVPSVVHPRGLIAPLLPEGSPIHLRLFRSIWRLVQGLYFHDAFRVAPAMAFHFFLSLLPLLVFIGWVVGALVKRKGDFLAPFIHLLPSTTGVVVEREAHRLSGADRLGPLAAVGFMWIASGGTQGLMEAVEAVVGAPRRPWWRSRLISGGWVLVSLVVVTFASYMLRWTHSGAVTAALALVASVVTLAAFYWVSVRHSKKLRRRVFPGALLAVALWMTISWAFSVYVRSLTDYALFYGSLAAVAVLLVWLWLASLAILVGAELNAQLEGLRDPTEDPHAHRITNDSLT